MMKGILQELMQVCAQLPEDAASKAAQVLEGHKRVFFYAAGRSGLMLRALAMRMAQMGKCVYVAGETVTPAIEAGDLLMLASASGNTQSVCRYARIARDVGADLFVISAAETSALAQIHAPDVLLPAPSKDQAGASGQVMGSLFEQSLLLFGDSVVMLLAKDTQGMRRMHANLE